MHSIMAALDASPWPLSETVRSGVTGERPALPARVKDPSIEMGFAFVKPPDSFILTILTDFYARTRANQSTA